MLNTLRDIFYTLKGKDNATTVTTLALHLGAKVTETTGANIRKMIKELIKDGEPIASCSAGYFRVSSRAELDEYIQDLQFRIDGIYERAQAVSEAYASELNSRHLNTSIPMKDRCRYYVIYLAEVVGIPYQAVYAMAYRKLSKTANIDLANLPAHYRGSTLNFIDNNGLSTTLFNLLMVLEEALV